MVSKLISIVVMPEHGCLSWGNGPTETMLYGEAEVARALSTEPYGMQWHQDNPAHLDVEESAYAVYAARRLDDGTVVFAAARVLKD